MAVEYGEQRVLVVAEGDLGDVRVLHVDTPAYVWLGIDAYRTCGWRHILDLDPYW